MLLRLLGAFVLGLLVAVWLGGQRDPLTTARLLEALGAQRTQVVLPADLTPEHRVGLALLFADGDELLLGHHVGHGPGEELTVVLHLDDGQSDGSMEQRQRILLIGDEINATTRWLLDDQQPFVDPVEVVPGPLAPDEPLAFLPGRDGLRQTPPGSPLQGDDADLVLRVWLP